MAPLTHKVCSPNCFVCLQKFQVEMSSKKYKKQIQVCEQFCVLVSRYLNLNNDRNCHQSHSHNDIIKTQNTMKMFKIGTQSKNRKKRLNSCESCLPLLESICTVYKGWNHLQLRLNRSIKLIAKLMQDVSATDGADDDDNFKEVLDFREKFINEAFDKRSSKDFPHLLLKRLSKDSLQLFRKNDNQNNLNYSSVDDELPSPSTPNVASNAYIKVEPEPTLEQMQVKADEGFCAAKDSDSDMWQPSDLYIDDDDDEANGNDGIIDRGVGSNNPKDSSNANANISSDNEISKKLKPKSKPKVPIPHSSKEMLLEGNNTTCIPIPFKSPDEGSDCAEDSDSGSADVWQPSDGDKDEEDDDDEANKIPKDSQNAKKNIPSHNEISKHLKPTCEPLQLECHICEICGKVLSRKEILVEHMNSHANSKPIQCRFCPRGFNRDSNRRYHEKKCDSNPKVPFMYKCGICDKRFCQYPTCYSHQKLYHKGQKPRVIKLDKVENKNADWRPDVAVSNDADVADDQNEAATVPTPNSSTEETDKKEQKNPKPYKCKLCSHGFARKGNLKLHMKTHTHPTRLFKCPFCQRGYKHSYSRNFHVRSCASNPKKTTVNKYKCYQCDDTTFLSSNRLGEHIEKEHGGTKRFPCKVCGQVFLTVTTLKSHNQRTHLNPPKRKPFPCQFCDKTFDIEYYARLHERRYCKKDPAKSNSLETSKTSKPGLDPLEPIVCDICGKVFRYQHSFDTHKKFIHSSSNPNDTTDTFPCQFCGRQYTLRNKRQFHENRLCAFNPVNSARFVCEKCGKDLPNKAALSKHMYHHKLEKGPGFPCSVCGKTFKLSDQRNNHERFHKEPAYACGYCGEKFIWNSSCRHHIKSRHKGQALVGRVVNLLKESLPANSARSVCETCGKDLPNRAAYHKHMYHHRLEKGPGFPCSVCGKTFKLSDQRNIHERGHNEPAYACGYCGEKFIWDNSCRNHIKSKHKGQTLVGRVVNLLKESLPASLPVPVEATVTENPTVEQQKITLSHADSVS